MTNINLKEKIYFVIIPTVILTFLLALIFDKNLGDLSSWLFVIPKVIAIEAMFFWLFQFYLWKCRIFKKWLVLFPNLGGTWIGEIHTNYQNPITEKQIKPIPCMSIVVHKFNQIKFKIITLESESISFSEQLYFDKSSNTKRITYSYTNDPNLLLDYRSDGHKGTVILNLVGDDKMEGYYFTNRGTKGKISLKRHCKAFLDELPQEIAKHPMKNK
ncbi:MAG: hypothetical protein RBQ97_11715 [Acholeplasma sp.]|jgi:hypothetical protein|nr:hypothetical protein [Acholeplasma sp.]